MPLESAMSNVPCKMMSFHTFNVLKIKVIFFCSTANRGYIEADIIIVLITLK